MDEAAPKTTTETQIVEKSDQILEGKTGEQLEKKKETPLDEARRLHKETRELYENISKKTEALQSYGADLVLGGHSLAGQEVARPKTEKEQALDKANKFVESWYS